MARGPSIWNRRFWQSATVMLPWSRVFHWQTSPNSSFPQTDEKWNQSQCLSPGKLQDQFGKFDWRTTQTLLQILPFPPESIISSKRSSCPSAAAECIGVFPDWQKRKPFHQPQRKECRKNFRNFGPFSSKKKATSEEPMNPECWCRHGRREEFQRYYGRPAQQQRAVVSTQTATNKHHGERGRGRTKFSFESISPLHSSNREESLTLPARHAKKSGAIPLCLEK